MPVECVVADTIIGGVAEVAMAEEKFEREGVGLTITVTPCWCYGSETMACLTLRIQGNPGDPVCAFIKIEYTGQLKKGERRNKYRESDNLIIPKNVGNATRGKEVTYEQVQWGNIGRAQ
ncbi:MAG: hypothetical protein ACYDIA_03640 [Candidatus Humimicrobiaceae bacterium]